MTEQKGEGQLVYCVACIDPGPLSGVTTHVFSTAEKAAEFCASDPRDHVTYDYVIDHPERMEQQAQ